MNDPFDPYFFIETEFTSRAVFLKWVKTNHPTKLRLVRQTAPYAEFTAGFNRVQDYFEERRKTTYLFSTSGNDQCNRPQDNLYMWGHYGLGHRGIALEFNTSNLARSILEHDDPKGNLSLDINDIWVKVEYKSHMTPLSCLSYLKFLLSGEPTSNNSTNPGLVGITRFLDQTIKIKHTVWSMEREWRLLWNNDSNAHIYHCPISENSLSGIYLGLRFKDEVKNQLLSVVEANFPSVSVWQAKKSEGNFGLSWLKVI